MTGSSPLARRSRRRPHQPATTTAERDTMSLPGRPNPSCGNCSSHNYPQAVSRQSWQREATSAAFDRRPERRGGATTGCGAVRQSGPGEPRAEATGGRGQACADRNRCVRQSGTWADLRHPDGTSAAGRIGRRNLRSAGHRLEAGGGAAPLQRASHHPGSLAHHIRHREAAHQPPPADRQTGGGV